MNTRAESTAYPKTPYNANVSGMKAYFMWRMTVTMRKRLILLAVCSLTSIPALALSLHPALYNNNVGAKNALLILFFVSIAGMFLITYMNALSNFNYLSKGSITDTSYSLPVSFKSRFWVDFISGILPSAVLYSLSAILGYGILLIEKSEFRNINDTLYNSLFMNLDEVAFILAGGLIGLAAMYCLIVLSISLCGRLFESALMPLVLGILIPAVLAFSYTLMYGNIREIYINDTIVDIIAVSSPFGFMAVSLMFNSMTRIGYNLMHAPGIEIIVSVLIIAAVCVIAAYFLMKRRKTEQVGKGIIHNPVFHVIITLITLCITELFVVLIDNDRSFHIYNRDISGYIVGMIITTFIVFMLVDIVIKRGFKKTRLTFARYAATFGGSVVLSVILMNMNGFGIGEFVPDIADIESVSTAFGAYEYDGEYYYEYLDYSNADYRNRVDFSATYTEEEYVGLILEAHKNCAKNKYYINRATSEVRVEYKYKNGKTQTFFLFMSDNEIDILKPLYYSKNYKEEVMNLIGRAAEIENISEKTTNIFSLAHVMDNAVTDNENFDKLFEAFKKDYLAETIQDDNAEKLGIIQFLLVNKVGNEIIDYTEGNKNAAIGYKDGKFYSDEFAQISYYDSYNYYNLCDYSFEITSRYVNLLAAMEELGLSVPELKDNLNDYEVRLYLYNYAAEDGDIVTKTVSLNDAIRTGNPDVTQLFSVSENYININHSEYTIEFFEKSANTEKYVLKRYRIPDEYAYVAEKLFNEANG